MSQVRLSRTQLVLVIRDLADAVCNPAYDPWTLVHVAIICKIRCGKEESTLLPLRLSLQCSHSPCLPLATARPNQANGGQTGFLRLLPDP